VRVSTVVMLALSMMAVQAPPPPPPTPRAVVAPGQPPRDVVRRPDPTGTGVIRGRVVAGDTGNPVRRASVNLQAVTRPPLPPPGTSAAVSFTTTTASGVPIQVAGPNVIRPRSVTTDSQGMFEFAGLPAGSYRLMANAGQYAAGYLGIAYGAKRPTGPGSSDFGATIELADGQRFDKATIALPRGAVITGRVSDDNGDPMARVQIYTLFFPPGSGRGQRMGMGAQTDDLGHFRLYGLTPGDYAVVAEVRAPTSVQPNAPPETEEDKIGFMTTYYPGTPDEAAAQRVRARAGAEAPGVEIRMATGRLFRISGMVTDSQGRTGSRVNGQLFKRTGSVTSSFGFSTDEQGRFQMRNVPPGNYRLVARGRNMGGGEGPQNEPGEMGSLPLTINSDLEGLVVMTSPGATITGQVVFEQGPPQLPPNQQSFQMRVTGMLGDPDTGLGMNTPQAAPVTPDLTFTMKGLHGELLLRSSGPGMVLKAVMAGGRDVTETPHEFKNGEQVTLVMTTRSGTVEGTVTDASGKPVNDAAILVFSDDKSTWRFNATRTRRGFVDPTGKYRVAGLLPGRYYVLATRRDNLNLPGNSLNAEVFEEFAKEATPFVIGDDEQRQVDLKMTPGGG
jgi:protocatechuate 3,4-dioxygenase beta subunit